MPGTALFALTDVPWPLVTAAAAAVVLFSFVILLAQRYKRCPSNRG